MNISWRSTFRLFLGVSVVVLALPFVLFEVEKLTGSLGQGVGPWTGQWQEKTMFLPSVVLVPAILAASILIAAMEKRLRPLVGGLGLVGLHVAGVLIQYEALGWLIEKAK